MASKTKTGIPETKGFFQFKGIVTGVGKENFYKEGKTKTQKSYRRVNFGLQVSKDTTFFIEVFGNVFDNVHFSKRKEDKSGYDTKAVPWKDRKTFKKKDYSLFGMNLGLTKTEGSKGKSVNDKKYMVDFDACEYIKENLEDGMSVFVKGKIQYGHYTNDSGELVRTEKFQPTQISLCREIDFSESNYEVMSQFTQTIVFMEIDKDEEKEDRFIISANIPTYSGVEFSEFIVNNSSLAKKMKSKLEQYNSIEVHGNVVSVTFSEKVVEDEVDDDEDGWGEENEMRKAFTSYRKEFVITGAEPKSLDYETYDEENINKAIAVMNKTEKVDSDFGDKKDEDWDDDDDDDDEGW